MSARRVALALESSGPGGAERTVLHLAEGLRAAGDDPVVVTLRPGWMTERAERAGIPVWIVPQGRGVDAAWVARLARRLRREGITVFHSHEFAMNTLGGAAAALARVRHVATVHGRRWSTERRRRVWAYRALARSRAALVAVSHDLAEFLAGGLGIARARFTVVHNGIPARPDLPPAERAARRAALRRELGVGDDVAVVLAVGNLYPVKDHATLLRAAARLDPVPAVAIAGRGGEEPRLRALARELGIEGRVHLLGVRDDVAALLDGADVFAQPSRSEGLPLSVLEAMHAGLPVVASRVGGIPEAVVDHETGLLVPPGDPEALADALAELLEDEKQRNELGAAARARARAEFSREAMVERYRGLYGQARGNGVPDAPGRGV